MKVTLEKSFPMPADVQTVWGALQNIEDVAVCMPGAKITERIDDTHFKGTVSVKVGPASMSFKGDIEVKELDASTHTLRLIGKGSDSSGTSGASMDLTARVEPGADAGSSNLIGLSEVTMSGKAAAFGGRMMGSVADQILKQFAGNFGKKVAAVAQAAPVLTSVAPVASVTAPASGATSAAMMAASATAPVTIPTLTAASPASRSVPAPVAADTDQPENRINALALFWAIVRDWFRNLFRRKPA